MKVSHDGRDLIASFESLSLKAYLCPAGVPTIGRGHTQGVKLGDTLPSSVAADLLLDQYLEACGTQVEAALQGAPTSQHEFDAMVSLAFNIGIGGFHGSTVLRKHRAGDKNGAAAAFALWNKATVNGELVEMPGLTRRRAAEAALYLTPDNGAPQLPMPQVVADPGIISCEEAIRRFQAANHLEPDGVVGPKTRAALKI